MLDLEIICKSVCGIAREAGKFILSKRIEIKPGIIESKGIHDYVTFVDKESERLIVKGLEMLIPESGFITEEKTIAKTGEIYNWIIDPLDGTTNYIHGIPVFCVSIGLRRKDELILGVIYEINLDEMFYSWEGGNAFLNGNIISVSKTVNLNDALLATGFPYYDYSRLDQYMELFKYFLKHTRGVRRPGSAAADLAYVASGRFDGFYEYGLSPWDVAAGAFLIKQAGGNITDFSGGNNYLFGKELVSGNSNMFTEFQSAIKKYMQI